MTDRVAPHGTWDSPVTPETVAKASLRLAEPSFDGGDLLWIEMRPAEGGRCVVVRRTPDGRIANLTPRPYSARTRVHEYGGGAYLASGSTVWFSNLDDQRLHRQENGGAPRPITPAPPTPAALRYADERLTPDGRFLIAVREEHPEDGEPVNTIVAVPADGDGEPRVIVEGSDFYAAPRVSPDGRRLAWLSWDHPRMPWDGTELFSATLERDGTVRDPERIAGGESESVVQPAFSRDGRLHFVSDRSGWWNLHAESEGAILPLCPMEAEWGVPPWVFGLSTYAFLDDGRIAAVVIEDGRERLGILKPGERAPTWCDVPDTAFHGSLRSDGRRLAYLGATPDEASAVVIFDPGSGRRQVVRESLETPVDPAWLPRPEPISFPSRGRTAHAIFHAPRNPEWAAPEGARPPLIVTSHGGPTSRYAVEMGLAVAFWTSRGFGVVQVNYGGSTGHGRAYRERLRGEWGVVDVEDCVAAARFLADRGDADPDRLIVRGGSAGGYTTLCALAFTDAFSAGASYYGVADAEALARDTHKFESRYLDGLLGPYPEARELYRERSPLHAADRIACPVVFFQGLEDPVVPPDQTRAMVEALRARGVDVECVELEGEQHGFRRAESIVRCLETELAFYRRVLAS